MSMDISKCQYKPEIIASSGNHAIEKCNLDLMCVRHKEGKRFVVEPYAGGLVARILAETEVLAVMYHSAEIPIELEVKVNDTVVVMDVAAVKPETVAIAETSPTCADAVNKLVPKWATYWSELLDKQRADYEASEQYIIDSRARERVRQIARERVNELLEELDDLIEQGKTSEVDLMKWIGAFAPANDHVAATFDADLLIRKFEELGFKENECTLTAQEIKDGTPFDPAKTPRWIMGQALAMLKANMPIHPVMGDKALKWVATQEENVV